MPATATDRLVTSAAALDLATYRALSADALATSPIVKAVTLSKNPVGYWRLSDAPTTQPNLILNPGFETGLQSWDSTQGGASSEWSIDAALPHGGSASALCTRTSLGSGNWNPLEPLIAPNQTVGSVPHLFPVTPGAVYFYSLWSKQNGGAVNSRRDGHENVPRERRPRRPRGLPLRRGHDWDVGFDPVGVGRHGDRPVERGRRDDHPRAASRVNAVALGGKDA